MKPLVFALLLAAFLLALHGCASTAPAVGESGPRWPDPAPREASGLAWLAAPGIVFAHDDDSVTHLYAWQPDSGRAYTIDLPGVTNRDWEDMTLIPREDGNPWVVIGDIGDNRARYPAVALLFFELVPPPDPAGFFSARFLGQVPFVYPDGPRDAEALVYDPNDNKLIVISKRASPPALYGLPLPEPGAFPARGSEPRTATFLGELDTIPPPSPEELLANPQTGRWSAQPTGAAISPDGSTLAVITYNDLHLFSRGENESWAEAVARPPLTLNVIRLRQTEAVTWTADNHSLAITSEGNHPPLVRIPLP